MPAVIIEWCYCCSEVTCCGVKQESVMAPCAIHQKQRTWRRRFFLLKNFTLGLEV